MVWFFLLSHWLLSTGCVCGTSRYLEGDAVWAAGRDGRWSRELAEAAVSCVGGGADGKTAGLVGSGALLLLPSNVVSS